MLALIWTLYLMAASILMLAMVGRGGVGDLSIYRPAARGLALSIMLGVCVLWPCVRLSQVRPTRGGLVASAQDIPIILIPSLAVIMPQATLGGWGVMPMLLMSVVAGSWTILVGGLLAIAQGRAALKLQQDSGAARFDAKGRVFWMLVVLAVGVLGVILGTARPDSFGPDLSLISPYESPFSILVSGSESAAPPIVEDFVIASVPGIIGCGLLGVAFARHRRI